VLPASTALSHGYLEKVTQARNGATWVAESDAGNLAGFAVLEWKREREDGVVAYVVTIDVLQEHRRQGVGSELLRRMEESAQASGAWCIWLHVDARTRRRGSSIANNGYDKAGAAKKFLRARSRRGDPVEGIGARLDIGEAAA